MYTLLGFILPIVYVFIDSLTLEVTITQRLRLKSYLDTSMGKAYRPQRAPKRACNLHLARFKPGVKSLYEQWCPDSMLARVTMINYIPLSGLNFAVIHVRNSCKTLI